MQSVKTYGIPPQEGKEQNDEEQEDLEKRGYFCTYSYPGRVGTYRASAGPPEGEDEEQQPEEDGEQNVEKRPHLWV